MIFDLHCDLLSYIASHPYRSAYDNECRASIPQLLDGNVKLQTMAVFTTTGASSLKKGLQQVKAYKSLSTKYEGYFLPFCQNGKPKIQTLLAIENASSFCLEDEPLENGIKRLESIAKEVEKPLYVSLTWNTENRFGGGSSTKVGLKEDGIKLMRRMQGLVYAIDLSHTSDKLAHDILTFIDKEKLNYKILASHSNFRAIQNVERNLPDEIADEIARRGGVIGLNLVRRFIGSTSQDLLKHVEYALKRGYESHLVLGADFFFEKSIPRAFVTHHDPYFFGEFDNASCYPKLEALLCTCFSKQIVEKIASGNLRKFLTKQSY